MVAFVRKGLFFSFLLLLSWQHLWAYVNASTLFWKVATSTNMKQLYHPLNPVSCISLRLDCEECQALFQHQNDSTNISGPSFVLDFPTSMGVPQRALLTLPYGLTISRSSIPSAGIGVLNHGPVVSPGMHFGPYEGEVTTMEHAMTSDYSWEVSLDISKMVKVSLNSPNKSHCDFCCVL